jgi:transcriptional regulator with XRE-family HTH domain
MNVMDMIPLEQGRKNRPPRPIRDTPGMLLRRARLGAGLSQEKLSELTEVSQAKISKSERDLAFLDSQEAVLVAGACGISPQLLMPKIAPPLPAKKNHAEGPAIEAGKLVLHPLVKESLDAYITRKRHVLSDVQVERLPKYARGVDPADVGIKVDDRLWDRLANLISELYSDEEPN